MYTMDVKKILGEMTIEQKAALCQGEGFWFTVPNERLNVPKIMVSDGPHGLRKQDIDNPDAGNNEAIKAVCFPTAAGTASSFDADMLREMGGYIGQSAQAENVGVVLGPAVNIKRSPLCGRNFEYFSEDPLLSTRMAAGLIDGIQRQGVGTSIKHFAVNNQETRRMSVSAVVSERALRQIYLASFEGAVKEARPWTVMCSYNKINGVYSSENNWLLNEVLRKEWGFDGLTMTDWGACNNHADGVAAGLDLEMPRACDADDQLLVDAVRSGKVTMEELDAAAENVLRLVERVIDNHREGEIFDRKAQHLQARKAAQESMVLLKNEGGILPLTADKKIAMIGKFAAEPRFQGGGSSHITCSDVTSALDAAKEICPVVYAQGYDIRVDKVDEALQAEAVRAAAEADVAVLFLGLPDNFESEGYDRSHLNMPNCQTALLEAVAAVQKNIVVVLHNGSPVTMPWIDQVPAVLEAYLGGQAGGGAVADILFGKVSPCGKLAETFPLRLEDTPCYIDFPGNGDKVVYSEDIWVGYRWYDKRGMDVLFPFGHGLTYTTFEYNNLKVSADTFTGDALTVTVDVTNTGSVAAKEIVQIYVKNECGGVPRPVRELRDFGKIALAPGETGTLTFKLDSRAFSYWDDRAHRWVVEPGRYVIEAAASSRDIRLAAPITADVKPLLLPLTTDSTVGDAMRIPGAKELLGSIAHQFSDATGADEDGDNPDAAVSAEMQEAMTNFLPLHCVSSFSGGAVTREMMEQLAARLNQLIKE